MYKSYHFTLDYLQVVTINDCSALYKGKYNNIFDVLFIYQSIPEWQQNKEYSIFLYFRLHAIVPLL